MFKNLKNKVREKTGADLPKLTASSMMFGKTRSNQHSRTNSQGSIASITSEHGIRDEIPKSAISNSQTSEEDSLVKTVDWESKLNEREKEWREREKAYVADLLKQTKELQEALAVTEENRKKLTRCQEEKEQLEYYQKQEIAKIKTLLLAKEEENSSNVTALKDALALVDSLKIEVSRLSPLEQQINNCLTIEKNDTEPVDPLQELSTKVELLSKENEALRQSNEESRRILDESLCKEISKNNELNTEIVKLKEYTKKLAVAVEEEKNVKDETLLRNAEISQMMQLTDQELKQQQKYNEELFKKMSELEEQLKVSHQNSETSRFNSRTIKDETVEDRIKELENEINDRNKTIRILQQNLSDVKKTFQTEFKNNLQANKTTTTTNNKNNSTLEEDVNNKYMKHVLIKFLTSSEYEAQQLIRAVATLLKLSSDEERLIKETLEWRSSWFGSKPSVGQHYNPS